MRSKAKQDSALAFGLKWIRQKIMTFSRHCAVGINSVCQQRSKQLVLPEHDLEGLGSSDSGTRSYTMSENFSG